MNDFSAQLTKVVKRYFDSDEVNFIISDLERWDILDSWSFYQITQRDNKPQFEIVFKSGEALIDYTYQSSRKKVAVVPVNAISFLTLTDNKSETHMNIAGPLAGLESYLEYTTAVDEYRKNLEGFFKKLEKLISGGNTPILP